MPMLEFWTFFLKKTQFSILLAIALTVFGLVSVLQMPRESTPKIEMPLAVVLTTLPGASATDVEKLVTNELEKPIKDNVDHIKKITSKSSNSVSNILVEFNTEADIPTSIRKLKDEVDAAKANLPDDASEPKVIQIDFAKNPILTFSVAGDIPRGALLDISEKLKNNLEEVPGVSSVAIHGVQEREIHILVKKDALERTGLLLQDITQAIAAQNATLPGGVVQINGTDYTVRFDSNIKTAQDIARIPITVRNGTPITVGDIATVIDGFCEHSSRPLPRYRHRVPFSLLAYHPKQSSQICKLSKMLPSLSWS